MTGRQNGIVAGYDGSAGSEQALDWAVREARSHRTVLTVCHAWPPGRPASPGGTPSGDAAACLARQYGERVVAAGVRHARGGMDPEDVRPLLVTGSPAAALCEVSGSADMVVLGSRGDGGLAGLLLGSVSSQVAAYAAGPVVVVHGHWRPVSGHVPRPIVAGADGSRAARAAVAFAFAEAGLHNVPLLAVCALADTPNILGGDRKLAADFEEALAKGEADHPEVVLRRQLAQGAPRTALLEAASTARLLVVGARGRGGLPGMMLGSVSLAVLHHAACPVAVVR